MKLVGPIRNMWRTCYHWLSILKIPYIFSVILLVYDIVVLRSFGCFQVIWQICDNEFVIFPLVMLFHNTIQQRQLYFTLILYPLMWSQSKFQRTCVMEMQNNHDTTNTQSQHNIDNLVFQHWPGRKTNAGLTRSSNEECI